MPITVTGMIETQIMLGEIGMTAKKRVTAKLHKKALEIAALARRMAPIDEGNLEKAIKVFPEVVPVTRERNALGQFKRVDIIVYVDMEMPVPERPGKTVGSYAYTMHEHLAPFGPYNLGERSEEKQSGQRELVGGKYLERAMEELAANIMGELSIDVLSPFGP